MKPTFTFLSLGWGVQSWTLAAMVALGDLPPITAAIHADTTFERSGTYQFAQHWTPWLEEHGVNVVIVNDAKQAQKVITSKTDIPAFTISENGDAGMLRRQCTGRWKITPIRRYISSVLTDEKIKKTLGVVEQWLGISLDEWHRAKDSDVRYIGNKFPLLDLKMTRQDCINYLTDKGLPTPPKSACVFCPYQSKNHWIEMRNKKHDDWGIAVSVDEKIRNVRPPFKLFVHPSTIPLKQIEKWDQQLDLFDVECDSGYCFL